MWNAAEASEKRKNSMVAREFEIALPEELDPAERRRLALDFAAELVQRHGCAADVAIHTPGKEGDHRNHHAHILTSTRRLGPDGFTEKTRELDDRKTGKELVSYWRSRWAELQNAALKKKGSSARVDHRSLAEQGLDRKPTEHLGPAASGYERRTGEPSRKRQDWAELASEKLASAKAQGDKEREALRSNAATALYVPRWIEEMKQNDGADTQPAFRGQARFSESGLCDLSRSFMAGNCAGAGRPAAIAAVVPPHEVVDRQGDMGLRWAGVRRESSSSSGSGSTGERSMMTGKIGEVLEGIRQAEKRQDADQVRDSRSLAEKIAAGRAGLRSMHSKAKEEKEEREKRDAARKLGEEEAKRKAEREQKQKQAQPEQKSSFKHPKPRGG